MSDEYFHVAPDVMTRPVGDELVLLDLASGTYFGLNPAGASLWQALGKGKTLSQAIDELAAEFDAPRARLEEDARMLVSQLMEQGLIRKRA